MALRLEKVSPAVLRQVVLRQSDLMEIAATNPADANEVLVRSTAVSLDWWAVLDPEEAVVAVFGVAPCRVGSVLPGIVCPWMLATDRLYKHKTEASRLAKRWLDGLLKEYQLLYQLVDARHAAALRWLMKLGFDVITTTTQGLNGEVLLLMTRRRDHVRRNITRDDEPDAVSALHRQRDQQERE